MNVHKDHYLYAEDVARKYETGLRPGGRLMTGKKWYVAAMNDGLFVIDAPPRPSTDHITKQRGINVIAVFGTNRKAADLLVKEHNERLEGGDVVEHCCHAVDCETPVPPKMHMCLPHWRMVPKAVQDLIWKHYRAGQENDKRPSIEYIATAFVSVSCVALKEGKRLPTLND